MASKIYINPETSIVWGESGGSGVTELLDLGGLTAATGIACGAYADLGAGPRADLYEVELYIDGFESGDGITQGQSVDLYFLQSNDATNFDGSPTTAPTNTSQGTVTANQARNGYYAASALTTTTTSAQTLRVRCVCRFTGRYIAPVVATRVSTRNLKSSSDNHRVIVTPIPYESQ